MIYLSELRIGNLVMCKNEIITVDDIISDCGINMRHDCWLYNLQHIEPVCLNDQWLINIGFEFIEESGGYCNKNHMIVISKVDDSMIFMPFCTNDDDCYITVNYVHEVQNICFVFGEELTIK